MAAQHMGVDISPATLADGTLLAALDPDTHPQLGTVRAATKDGPDSPMAEGNNAPRPVGNLYQTGNPGALALPSGTAVQ